MQLLNAGCRVTSIQRFLGHKKLSSTLIYAKAHDQTVADDYFAAMGRVEERLQILPPKQETEEVVNVPVVQDRARLLFWMERLALPKLGHEERLEIVDAIRCVLSHHSFIVALDVLNG